MKNSTFWILMLCLFISFGFKPPKNKSPKEDILYTKYGGNIDSMLAGERKRDSLERPYLYQSFEDLEEIKTNAIDDESIIYEKVEKMPVFENGKDDINTFLAKNINYPLECKESSIQGTVFIKFVVQAAGGIRDIQVMKSPKECNMLEKEAIRVVKLSGNYWKAGKQNGKKVDVYNILPIRFKLQ